MQVKVMNWTMCSNSGLPVGAGLSMAQLCRVAAVTPLRANRPVCSHTVVLDTVPSFAFKNGIKNILIL